MSEAQWQTTAGSLLRSRLRATSSDSMILGPASVIGGFVLSVPVDSPEVVPADVPIWLVVVQPTIPTVSASSPAAMIRRASRARRDRAEKLSRRPRVILVAPRCPTVSGVWSAILRSAERPVPTLLGAADRSVHRRLINEKTSDRMMVSTTLPMIEMFHPKKNFRTASTRTKMARLPRNDRCTSDSSIG